MTIPVVKKNRIPEAPPEYDRRWMQHVINSLDLFMESVNNAGTIRATRITITDLPTSASGLETGALWNDSGTVKVA